MSVDIYVMPLTRYLQGDFESPLEMVFGTENVHRVGAAGLPPSSTSTFVQSLMLSLAYGELDRLLGTVQAENAEHSIQWNDEGGVVFAEQAFCPEAARTYAKWRSHAENLGNFTLPEEGDFWSHPVWRAEGRAQQFAQLTLHDCYYGYFLPCEFDNMIEVDAFTVGNFTATRSIGSSIRLRDELLNLGELLQLDWRQGIGLVDPHAAAPDHEGPADNTIDDDTNDDNVDGDVADSPLEIVKASVMQLSHAAELSCEHRLPIIFDG